ncbi:hypothetical protein [Tenuibacillus multivorans]|uniref:Lipoprotein n=1 Tax=Tenuibacillus multivorans TaxID=237069 RepID=A0A1G9WLR3_9BACI|nr:hypothetical protein [Tenuibacillus multivorans]GEL78019.1 hypothetical protein TMU01_22540 [Tenuibacillus multivorans]SDM85287.1 hypothetical protein SAMN05216498_0796 [Tenuibacillus multivorans]
MKKIYMLLFFLILIVACQPTEKLESKTFEEIYPNNLSDVTNIDIKHGNGELKSLDKPNKIKAFLSEISDISFTPDEDQEGEVGYLYSVSLYEGEEVVFSFNTSQIDDFYYENNEELLEILDDFWGLSNEK